MPMPRMETRPAAYAVVIEDEKILLARWVPHIPGYKPGLTLPGGGMEPGEQPAETALREVYEETGYTVELDGLLGVHAGHFDPNPGNDLPFCALRIIYRAHTVGGALRSEVGGSTDLALWVPLAELGHHVYYPSIDEAARMMGYTDAMALSRAYQKKGAE